ncbi:MAG: hypothetical protein GY788_01100, partial [bacterium]|nr:hypothetical protein [bacterium]
AGGELADDLLRRVPSSRHLWVLSCHRHDDGDDQTTQLLDHYKGLISGGTPSPTNPVFDDPETRSSLIANTWR